MLDYNKIKRDELENTKNFSYRKMNLYIKSHRILLALCSHYFLWALSLLIFIAYPFFLSNTVGVYAFFVASHMIFWRFWGEKSHKKDFSPLIEEMELTIQVLKDIQKEKGEE